MPHRKPPGAQDGSISDTDLDALFGFAWERGAGDGAVLAVSGGADSTAMLHLFARWLALRGVATERFCVATVDHGLRPASAAEAESVMQQAQALGFPAVTLHWQGAKPERARAEAARRARYRLLADLARQRGVSVVFTAHTADDQAETVLMRLARGSGVDGLSGMVPLRAMEAVDDEAPDRPLWLARPLLRVEKARLEGHLRQAGIPWHQDPTNTDTDYERPRFREARPALHALGLTPAALGLSARRLQRAHQALEATARAFYAQAAHVHVSPLGYVALEREALLARPHDIALRVLRLAILAAGGSGAPVSLSGMEALLEAVHSGPAAAGTLARATLRVRGRHILVEREPGRIVLPRYAITAGVTRIWDGRFRIAIARAEPGLQVGPLGPEGLAGVAAAGRRPAEVPARTLHALPAIWQGSALVAVPSLGFAARPPLQLSAEVEFLGLTLHEQGMADGA